MEVALPNAASEEEAPDRRPGADEVEWARSEEAVVAAAEDCSRDLFGTTLKWRWWFPVPLTNPLRSAVFRAIRDAQERGAVAVAVRRAAATRGRTIVGRNRGIVQYQPLGDNNYFILTQLVQKGLF